MSNRIANARITDRVELAQWAPRAGWWDGLQQSAREWFRQASAANALNALSPRLRGDIGLDGVAAADNGMLDVEARRLGF